MKILFDHPNPFLLAHGGFQTQIEQTKAGLESLGVEVEYLRWWDEGQKGDLIHFFSVAPLGYLQQAKVKRLPVVMTTLFTETCNRSDLRLYWQGVFVRLILALPVSGGIKHHLPWLSYKNATHNVVGLEAEQKVLEKVYGVSSDAISIVPLGLSKNYLRAGGGTRSQSHLICTGTITERKCTVEIATMARDAKVPVLFVGKPYSKEDPYWCRFESLIDDQYVKYQRHVADEMQMIDLLQTSRGFVLKSFYENWCLSAHEAAACGLPVLLPDQKWSHERFGDKAHYFSGRDLNEHTELLRKFYEACPGLSAPMMQLYSWKEVADRLVRIYELVLRNCR